MNHITKILLASSALSVSATSGAFAAPAAFNWSGFYVGGNVGFVSARSSVADGFGSTPINFLSGATFSANGTSLIGGFQAGYNWQMSNVVFGLEGDLSFGSQNRSTNVFAQNQTSTFSSRLSALGTIRGRIGFAVDRFLVYGTGGVAFADLKNTFNDPIIPFTAGPGSSVTGWAAGAGVEFVITQNWIARAEYLHAGFADRSASTPVFTNFYVFAFKNSFDIGRLGLSYKF